MLCEEKHFSVVYFIVFSKNFKENASHLKEHFEKNFQNRYNYTCQLKTFSRTECLKYFGVLDDGDEISIIHNILKSKNLQRNSAIFLDETPLMATWSKSNYCDWLSLENSRTDVLLVVAFQPIVEASMMSTIPVDLVLPFTSVNVALTRSYRPTMSIFKALKDFHHLDIKRVGSEAKSGSMLIGSPPEIVNYDNVTDGLKTWMLHRIIKFRCNVDKIKILYTDATEEDARAIFEEKFFQKSLVHWKDFIGCEAPVIVSFYLPDDEYWTLMYNVSRAQQKVRNLSHLYLLLILESMQTALYLQK